MQCYNGHSYPFAGRDEVTYPGSAKRNVRTFYRDFPLPHSLVLRCALRFIFLVAGRRWGKTWLALWKMVLHAAATPGQFCYFIGPTLKQAREIAWYPLLQMLPPQIVRRIRYSDLEVQLINDSTIRVCGPSHLRGSGLDYVVLDEYAHFSEPAVFSEVIRPMLADREGRAFICSTPNGLNHLYDLFLAAQTRPDCATFHFPTWKGGFVSERELDALRSTMDPRLYAQEIEARFEPLENRVYYAFSRETNIREVELDNYLPLLIGLDFNVSQMSAVIAQKGRDECRVCEEIILHNSNTYEMIEELTRRFPRRGVVHPDPSCFARKTSAEAGVTDCSIIQNYGWYVHPTKPYPVTNRVNAVNAMLRNANGRSRLVIDPKCKYLIRALDGVAYQAGSRIPDKSTGLDHAADALGYLVAAVFPMSDPNGFSMTNAFTGADLMA